MLALENKYQKDMDFIIADVNEPEGNSLAQQFNIYYIPVFFVLDGKGKTIDHIEYSQIADSPQKMLDSRIAKAIAGK